MPSVIVPTIWGDHYEIVSFGGSPSSSCSDRYPANDAALVFTFITRDLKVEKHQWSSILQQLGVSLSANYHPDDVYKEVTQLCLYGRIQLYKLPALESLPALSLGNGWGYCFVRGPKLHCRTRYSTIAIKNTQEAEALLDSVNATEKTLLNCLSRMDSTHALLSSSEKVRPQFIELLACGKLLAYKVPVHTAAPAAPKEEYLPAQGPGNQPVPLAPETKTTSSLQQPTISRVPVEKSESQSLEECEQRLGAAREKLETSGYQPKYTDEQLFEKLNSGSVSKERFLVSFQEVNTNSEAKLAFQRESGLVPIWATTFDQLEYADSDPELIAAVIRTPYDPEKQYVLHIIDRGETLDNFGQNTFIPTWENMQAPVQQYLGGIHDPKILTEVMTPEYQRQYAEHIKVYHTVGLDEFSARDQEKYASSLSTTKENFLARHAVRTELGANNKFTGRGLTGLHEGSTDAGVLETLTLENNPPSILKMSNVKSIHLMPRGKV